MRISRGLETLRGIVAVIALLGAAPAAYAQAGAEKPGGPMGMSKGDQKIVTDLAQGNLAELACARLAQGKAQDENARTFAQQMIDDHNRSQTELQQLASAKGLTLPTVIDKEYKAMTDKLSALSGAAFDKAYMAQCGVSAHRRMHSLLATAEKKAKDPDLKALVTRLAPAVEQHLKAAQQIRSAKGAAKDDKGERFDPKVGAEPGK